MIAVGTMSLWKFLVAVGSCLLLTADAFSTLPPMSSSLSSQNYDCHVTTRLHTSLSPPPPSVPVQEEDNDGDDDDGDIKNASSSSSLHFSRQVPAAPTTNQKRFRRYLKTLLHHSSPEEYPATARHMDDDLKRMEYRHYYYNDDDDNTAAQNERPAFLKDHDTQKHYEGPTVQPDRVCYSLVASAYAKAGMGRIGGELTEDVYQRCQHFLGHENTNVILKTACLRAWASADDFAKADAWLQDMEDTYAETRSRNQAPDAVAYSCYLEEMSRSKSLKAVEKQQRAEEIMNRMKRAVETGQNPFARPNQMSYIAAMKCIATVRNGIETLEKVEGLLRDIKEQYQLTGDYDVKPTARVYVHVVNVAAQCGGGIQAARTSYGLLQELNEMFAKTEDRDYLPIEGIYTSALTAYARGDADDQSPSEVDDIINDFENNIGIRQPSVHVYTAAINAKIRERTLSSTKKAEEILRRMHLPDSVAYQCVIKAYSRMGDAKKAINLLWELWDLADEGKSNPPDVGTISSCIVACSKQNGGDDIKAASTRALTIANRLYDAYKSGKVKSNEREIDLWVLDDVVRLLSLSHQKNAGELAEAQIRKRQEVHSTTGKCAPTFHTYVLAIDAWANSGGSSAGKHALSFLGEIQQLYDKGILDQGVDERVLSTAMNAVSKSPGPNSSRQVEDLFQRIINLHKEGNCSSPIDARLATCALSSIMKSHGKTAPVRATSLLKQLSELETDKGGKGSSLNTIVYNSVLHGLADRGLVLEAEQLLSEMNERSKCGRPCCPDMVTVSFVCRAIAKDASQGAGARAERHLREAEAIFNSGDETMKLDSRLYNAVINAYAKEDIPVPENAASADRLLGEMIDSIASDHPVPPDLITISLVCQAYAKGRDPAGPMKVEEVFERAVSLADSGVIPRLDYTLCSSILTALSRSKHMGALQKAESLLRRMNDIQVPVDTKIFDTLLSGWSTSDDEERLTRCLALFSEMTHGDANIQPDTNSHNWVILAAARSPSSAREQRRKDFEIALNHFRTLHKADAVLRPSSYTYAYFIKACRTLLPNDDDRQKLVSKAFSLCQRNGMVSKEVLGEVFRTAPDLLQEQLERGGITFDKEQAYVPHIPEPWCSDLNPRRRLTRRIDLRRWH